MQEKNWVITTIKGKVTLPFLWGNGEEVIPIYGYWNMCTFDEVSFVRIFWTCKSTHNQTLPLADFLG